MSHALSFLGKGHDRANALNEGSFGREKATQVTLYTMDPGCLGIHTQGRLPLGFQSAPSPSRQASLRHNMPLLCRDPAYVSSKLISLLACCVCSVHLSHPHLPHYMTGKYVPDRVRLDGRYPALEWHLTSICSLASNKGYKH